MGWLSRIGLGIYTNAGMPLQWSDEGEDKQKEGEEERRKWGFQSFGIFVDLIMLEVFRFCGSNHARSLGELGTDIDFLPGLLKGEEMGSHYDAVVWFKKRKSCQNHL